MALKHLLVSVILPVHNGERYLTESIESILSQNCHHIEILVVDDGSTDGSLSIANRFGAPVQVTSQRRKGAAEARNHGIAIARGEFIAFLDADDVWTDRKLQRQLEAFRNEPDLDMVFGHLEHFFSPEIDDDIRRQIHCPKKAIPGYSPVTLLARSAVFKRVGPFSSKYRVGEFVEWYLRGTEMGLRSQMLEAVLVKRRLHENNMGRHTQEFQKDYVRILKASLDRRRKR